MSKRRWLILAVVVVVFAAGIAVGVTAFGSSSSAAAVTLESATTTGTHPFTTSAASGAIVISANVQAATAATRKSLAINPKTHTLVATGTAPGLYGGSGNAELCNRRQVVEYLRRNPDKAAAWAGVLGITTGDIASYVATLTPVLLTNDTLVTNHGYFDGHATALQSVLQAGTAVMVDATGTPRVKCNCGNPLTPPEVVTTAQLRGTGWPGYMPTQVTVVNAGPVTQSLTVLNVATGQKYVLPVGSGTTVPASPANAHWVAVESLPKQGGDTSIITSTDGDNWSTIGPGPNLTSGLAYGDGEWTAVAEVGGAVGGGLIYRSSDLRTWAQVASVPGTLSGVAYHDGRWVAVGSLPGSSGNFSVSVVYSSTDGKNWPQVFATDGADTRSVGFGGGQWLAAADEVGASSSGAEPGIQMFASNDGAQWGPGTRLNSAMIPWLGFGSGKWLLGDEGATTHQLFESSAANTWTPFTPTGLGATTPTVASYGNGTWLAAGQYGTVPAGSNLYPGSAFFSSPDGKTWTRAGQVYPPISAIACGPTPKGGATTTTSSPTTAPPTTVRSTTVPPTAAAPTTAIASASPPCDQSLIQAAVAAGGSDVQLHSISCVGVWAAWEGTSGQDDISGLVHWNGSVWELEDRGVACTSGEVPKVNPFWQIACDSN